MLESLFLRDFVIVEAAEIEFSGGFCALSGETGAGKSILLDALGLALGGRADAAMLRRGAAQTEISAAFTPTEAVDAWLRERDLGADETELRLRRLVFADGRSKAFINGSPVTVGQLRDWLVGQGRAELATAKNLRCAVNQDMAKADAPIRDGDEIAFFPPVTGG